tara:strand:+ start:4475 stop:5485 length:1011 start_codon:yes stop_codon:yes gene_type:complete
LFLKYKIKVHIDPHEIENEILIKQIAINLLDGCSLGYNCSYISEKEGIHYNYYPNDVFFCWGKKDLKNFKRKIDNKTATNVNYFLTSGYPYTYFPQKKQLEINSIKTKLKNSGAKFTILFLDTSAGTNSDYYDQFLSIEKLEKIYKFLFNLVLSDKEVGLILKPKKTKNLKELNNLDSYINSAINTGRCHVVNNASGGIPWHYSEISDVVLSVTIEDIPTSLLDCIINNRDKRAAFINFSNLKKLDPDFYSWGKDRVVFDDVEKMINSLIKFKSEKTSNGNFGLWKKDFIDEFDSFRDNKCGYRVGNYIKMLLENFDKGLSKNQSIEIANKNFLPI